MQLVTNDSVMHAQPLCGRTIFVLEDEAIVSFLIEDMLKELGCTEVLHAASVAKALALLDVQQPDAALLDVNLGRELAYPVAARLDAQSIPFIFVTGYGRGGLASEWAMRAVLQKPFDTHALGHALNGLLHKQD